MKYLLKTKRELLLNKSSNILNITGLPNTKKTFFGILFSPAEPIIYLDFAFKTLANLVETFHTFQLGVYQVPYEQLQDSNKVLALLSTLERGTIVIDGIGMMNSNLRGEAMEILMQLPKTVAINLITNSFTAWTKARKPYLSISLPTPLLPLDKRLIDMLFIKDKELIMLGRTEVKWSI